MSGNEREKCRSRAIDKRIKHVEDMTKLISKHFEENTHFDNYKFFSDNDFVLRYNDSGSIGHVFDVINNEGKVIFCVKFAPFKTTEVVPNDVNVRDIHDPKRDINAEYIMYNLLKKLVYEYKTPHIALPMYRGYVDTKCYYQKEVADNRNFNKFLKRYEDGTLHEHSSVMFMEHFDMDASEFIKRYYKKLTSTQWKVFFFQILSAMAVVQLEYPFFRHNDFKPNNVLVNTKVKFRGNYTINSKHYRVPGVPFMIGLFDFDLSCIKDKVMNHKAELDWWLKAANVSYIKNHYFDIHYFFNCLTMDSWFPGMWKGNNIPQDAREFIKRIVPSSYTGIKEDHLSAKGRVLCNNEVTTPLKLLENDEYFMEFRIKKSYTLVTPDMVLMPGIIGY